MTILERIRSISQLDEVLQFLVADLGADSGTIHLLGEDGLLHLTAATADIPEVVLAKVRRIRVGKGMAGLAVERRRPVDACNIQTDASGDVRPGARATGLEGAVVVPIFRGTEAIGALGVANRRERIFTEGEIETLLAAGREIGERSSRI